MKRTLSRICIRILIAALCAGILAFWVLQELPCPLRAATGLPCPGCGMGRAWLAFLRLDISQAFAYHPMFWTVPVVGVFVLLDGKLFRRKHLNHAVLILILLGLLLCWVIRLIAFYQGTLSL